MKISHLPDRTRMQTVKPYVDGESYKCIVMAVTMSRGCERGVVDIKSSRDIDFEWQRIHDALVRTVCELKRVDPSLVTHITDRNQIFVDEVETSPRALRTEAQRPNRPGKSLGGLFRIPRE